MTGTITLYISGIEVLTARYISKEDRQRIMADWLRVLGTHVVVIKPDEVDRGEVVGKTGAPESCYIIGSDAQW